MKEAKFYEKIENDRVRCLVCSHHCTVAPGACGTCGVRANLGGKLYLMTYGQAVSEAIDPIEKKPFYHFLPGSSALSIATVGCNFRCDNCQNWQISQSSKNVPLSDLEFNGDGLQPEQVISDALSHRCASVAYTCTEPTVWMEYALACMKLARKNNIKNVWVSNGYMSNLTVSAITPYLDAINVDLKFFDERSYRKNCGGQLEPVLRNLVTFKKAGTWVEVTTLVIPTLSDSPTMFGQIAEFIVRQLGPETPWHLSAFSPAISYRLSGLPATDPRTLEQAWQIGKRSGLRYVYLGNVPNSDRQHTSCPKCGKIVIKRFGYTIERADSRGVCPHCNKKLEIIT